MNKLFGELQIGDYIFDMHNWVSSDKNSPFWIKQKHRVTDFVRVSLATRNGCDVVKELLKNARDGRHDFFGYTNKMLVIVDIDHDIGRVVGQGILKCAWSYDGTTFGMLKVVVDLEPQTTET
jgi:hypothetical protein